VKRQASAHAQKYGIVLTLGVLSCPAIARRAASGDRRTRGASAPSNQELTVLSIKNLTKTYPGGTRALHGVSLKSIWRNERAPEGVARGKAQVQHRKFDPGIRDQFQAHACRDRCLQQKDRPQSVVRHRSHFVVAPVLLILIFPVFATGQAKEGAWSKKKSPWVSLSPAERTQVQDFSEDYKQYLDVARSALGSTKERNSRQASWLRCP